jgi:hypothetical protein
MEGTTSHLHSVLSRKLALCIQLLARLYNEYFKYSQGSVTFLDALPLVAMKGLGKDME